MIARRKKSLCIVFICVGWIILFDTTFTIAQISAQASDFPILGGVKWGMSMQEVQNILSDKKDVKTTSSSLLSFQDVLLGNKVEIFLRFIKNETGFTLNSTYIAVDGSNDYLHSVDRYFLERYGNKYEKIINHEWGVDKEKKIWRLMNESVELQIFQFKEIMIRAEITYNSLKTISRGPRSRIQVKASEFPTLTRLQWGMTKQEALTTILGKYTIIDSAHAAFTYVDTLPMTKVKVTLKFNDDNSSLLLSAIDAELMEANKRILQSLANGMVNRYGQKYDSTSESQSKFLLTLTFGMKQWSLTHEHIGLLSLSRGDEVQKINLKYRYSDTK